MSARTFVDTNVLIYAHDIDAGRKHEIGKKVLLDLWAQRAGILSMQVLQEFYTNATRKLSTPLPKPRARAVVDTYAVWCVDGVTKSDMAAAFRIENDAKINFWDALIIAVAVRSGATRLLSEDLNPGQEIAGLIVENPFAA
jgi:predicted nucleic acid-binding protein